MTKRAVAHHNPDGTDETFVALRDDEGETYCLGCRLLLATTDEDEAWLPIGHAVRDPESGYFITLCPDCRATFEQSR